MVNDPIGPKLEIRSTVVHKTTEETPSVTHHHRRTNDADDFGFEHKRLPDDSPLRAIVSILGMPIGTLAAIATVLLALGGVWLTHDRAIAAAQTNQAVTDRRVDNIEKREEKRSEQEAIVNAALARIEAKLDDVKERVSNVESNQGRR